MQQGRTFAACPWRVGEIFRTRRKIAENAAARVEVWKEGKMVFTEEYSDIKADRKLDAALFDPKQFNAERRP